MGGNEYELMVIAAILPCLSSMPCIVQYRFEAVAFETLQHLGNSLKTSKWLEFAIAYMFSLVNYLSVLNKLKREKQDTEDRVFVLNLNDFF